MDINTVVYHNCDICSALYPYSDDLYLGIVREILATDFFCPTSSSLPPPLFLRKTPSLPGFIVTEIAKMNL